jgi:peptidoglycan/xylan/chitin deacetylase (PgdA/CDA1 family)
VVVIEAAAGRLGRASWYIALVALAIPIAVLLSIPLDAGAAGPVATPRPGTPAAAPNPTPQTGPNRTPAKPQPSPASTPTATPASRLARPLAEPSEEPLPPVVKVPILMYHYIRVNPDPADDHGYNLSVTPWDFAAQMEWLAEQGYQTISFAQLVAYFRENRPLPDNPIILTFDDGYDDFYEEAYPVLQAHGFGATVFMITGLVNNWRYLKDWQIAELSAAGIEFGGHTANHVDVRWLGKERTITEIYASKEALEAIIGKATIVFCYPAGLYDGWSMGLVGAAGYQAAVTTQPGLWHSEVSLLALPRVRVSGGIGVAGLAGQMGRW